jgi:glycerol kinase
MDLVVALDAGTSSVRAVAFDDRARVVVAAQRPLPATFPRPGEVEQDPAEIADLCVAVLREVAVAARHRGDRVVALGLTNQRETTVAFDRESGHLAHRALVWQDRRTASRCQELREAGHERRVREVTGLVLDPYFSATKMAWLLERGVLDAARSPALATVDTWLVWWLSGGAEGGTFLTEASNASRTALLDLETLDWSAEMTHLFGVPLSALAPVRPSTGELAHVASVVPELEGVPILAVLGDQQAALFGQACFTPGQVKATYGTGAFVLANAGEVPPPVVEGLLTTVAWDLGAFGPAAYALEGSAFVAGAAVQWLRDELGLLADSAEVTALAETIPDAGGVSVVPAFTGLGSPFWRAEARGAVLGLSAATTRAHLARAVLESIAFSVRAMTDAFAEGGVALFELRADGGAAASDLLLSLQATASRLVVRRGQSLEATARGAASAAALAAGMVGSLEEIAALWKEEAAFSPEAPDALDAAYLAWRRAVDRA